MIDNMVSIVEWEGVVLTEAEACDALDRLQNAHDETAASGAGGS